jgi:hypothetical protein
MLLAITVDRCAMASKPSCSSTTLLEESAAESG